MNTKALVKVIEDIYTLTWDYNKMDPTDAEDMKCLVDTINYIIQKFFARNRVRIIWVEDEDKNVYRKEDVDENLGS